MDASWMHAVFVLSGLVGAQHDCQYPTPVFHVLPMFFLESVTTEGTHVHVLLGRWVHQDSLLYVSPPVQCSEAEFLLRNTQDFSFLPRLEFQ
jgi:hypothetical protein